MKRVEDAITEHCRNHSSVAVELIKMSKQKRDRNVRAGLTFFLTDISLQKEAPPFEFRFFYFRARLEGLRRKKGPFGAQNGGGGGSSNSSFLRPLIAPQRLLHTLMIFKLFFSTESHLFFWGCTLTLTIWIRRWIQD